MRYKKIFSVALLHDYYPGGNGGVYRFVPTEACQKLMQATGAFMKTWNNILYVVTRIENSGKPVIPIPDNARFEFFVEPADGHFFMFTAAGIQTSQLVYWIKNEPFPSDTPSYLFPAPVGFSADRGYHAGDIVLNESKQAYRATGEIEPGSNLADAAKWQLLGATASIRSSSRLFFSNGAPVSVGGIHYINPMPAAFNAGHSYRAGQMVLGDGSQIFEAIKNNPAGTLPNDVNAWVNRGIHPYATDDSLLQMHGQVAVLPVVPAEKNVQVNISKVFPGNIKPPVPIHADKFIYKDAVSVHPADLSELPAGLYEIEINNIKHTVYADAAMRWQDYPLLISIGHYVDPSPAVPLTDNNGLLLSPEYAIRFAPRSVMWRLQFRGASLPTPADNNSPDSVLRFVRPGVAPNTFLSEKPVRLQRASYKDGILLLNNNDPPDTLKINQLPAPGLMALETIRQNQTDYFMTTTNLYS